MFFSVIMDFAKQYAAEISGKRKQLRGFFRRAVMLGQRVAFEMEKKGSVRQNPFYKSFTTGFGVVATK
jgi:hypothetical protein